MQQKNLSQISSVNNTCVTTELPQNGNEKMQLKSWTHTAKVHLAKNKFSLRKKFSTKIDTLPPSPEPHKPGNFKSGI